MPVSPVAAYGEAEGRELATKPREQDGKIDLAVSQEQQRSLR